MRVQIKPTHQIQRINSLQNQLSEFEKLDRSSFMKRPHEKAWCGAEVLKHMIVAQSAYTAKIETALKQLSPSEEEIEVLKTRAVPSFLIKRFPPIEGKIRFKMKTSKQFKPMLEVEKLTSDEVDQILNEMKESLVQLSTWVEETRKKDTRPVRFNSAIGPVVRFNASEACEFILCHNERHFQQLKNTVNSSKNA